MPGEYKRKAEGDESQPVSSHPPPIRDREMALCSLQTSLDELKASREYTEEGLQCAQVLATECIAEHSVDADVILEMMVPIFTALEGAAFSSDFVLLLGDLGVSAEQQTGSGFGTGANTLLHDYVRHGLCVRTLLSRGPELNIESSTYEEEGFCGTALDFAAQQLWRLGCEDADERSAGTYLTNFKWLVDAGFTLNCRHKLMIQDGGECHLQHAFAEDALQYWDTKQQMLDSLRQMPLDMLSIN